MTTESKLKIGVIGVADGWSSNRLADAMAQRTGSRHLIEMDHLVTDLESGKTRYNDDVLETFDALVVKKIGAAYSPMMVDRMEILRYLQHRGVKIFSSPRGMAMAMDRLSCTLTLKQGDLPLPPTIVTECLERAVEAVQEFGEAVLKPIYTSKARGMKVVSAADHDLPHKIAAFRDAGNAIIYIQKKMALPGRDLGLVFLGGNYIGTYARVSVNGSWNTTTRSGGRYEAHEPAPELISLAEKAQRLFDLEFTSVDIAETSEGPVVFEVSAFGGFRGLLEASGIDAAELYADHVVGRMREQ